MQGEMLPHASTVPSLHCEMSPDIAKQFGVADSTLFSSLPENQHLGQEAGVPG